jgi:hypothetical protein
LGADVQRSRVAPPTLLDLLGLDPSLRDVTRNLSPSAPTIQVRRRNAGP